MTQPVEIIPTVGLIQQATPREPCRSSADHIALIRRVLVRHLGCVTRDHDEQRCGYMAVEEVKAALYSLAFIEPIGGSVNQLTSISGAGRLHRPPGPTNQLNQLERTTP